MTSHLHALVAVATHDHRIGHLGPDLAEALLAIATTAVDAHTPAQLPAPADLCPHPHATHAPPWGFTTRICLTSKDMSVCRECTHACTAPTLWPRAPYQDLAQALTAHNHRETRP